MPQAGPAKIPHIVRRKFKEIFIDFAARGFQVGWLRDPQVPMRWATDLAVVLGVRPKPEW